MISFGFEIAVHVFEVRIIFGILNAYCESRSSLTDGRSTWFAKIDFSINKSGSFVKSISLCKNYLSIGSRLVGSCETSRQDLTRHQMNGEQKRREHLPRWKSTHPISKAEPNSCDILFDFQFLGLSLWKKNYFQTWWLIKKIFCREIFRIPSHHHLTICAISP